MLPVGCGNSAGLFGLEDWMRDLIFGPIIAVGGDLAVALLTPTFPGAEGPTGPTGPEGPQGSAGPAGPDGTDHLFDVFIDEFFKDTANPGANFTVNIVAINEPILGTAVSNQNLAFKVLIPSQYAGSNSVVMRVALLHSGPVSVGSLAFEVFGRRLQNGSTTIENYINPPSRIVTMTATVTSTEFILLDIPINVAVPNGLGGAALVAGDELAFEFHTISSNGGAYQILGVEFFETTTTPTVAGATIS
jgi:hypothetical protein